MEQYHPRNPRTPCKTAKNNETLPPNQVSENSVISQVHENGKSSEDVTESNLRQVRTTGLARIMELTQNTHKNIGVLPKSKSVKVDNEFPSLSPFSPVKTKLDDESKEKTENVGFFKSIWDDASPNSPKMKPVTPQSKLDIDKIEKKMDASPQTKEPSKTATDEKVDVSTPQNGKEGSPKSKEVANSPEKKPIPSNSILNHLNPALKLTPILNFQPDFEKTIYQFGYKLSIHILSLNAIIKMYYGDKTKIQFYRYV